MSRLLLWIPVTAAVVVTAGMAVRAQTPAPPGAGFTTSTTAVVVDVVVRDGKGAPITDVKPSDFELLEDGARQRITSVELIAPGRATSAGAKPATPGPRNEAAPAAPAATEDATAA